VTHILGNDKVGYLVGSKTVKMQPLVPYHDLLCEFLNDLSSDLRSSQEAAAYPDIMTFAFWCRKANIAKLKADFQDGKARLGLGLVFHITPSNVPVNFAFSFAFGLLSGNANIVKVPSKNFAQINIICACLNRLFDNAKYSEIKAMTAFVRYEPNDEITARFCADCNARIIWGGDVTIRNIRKLPLPERSVEIVFSDRYSFCVIDAPSVIKLDQDRLKQLAQDFYNDTYLMDQNACSSPHLIVWQGEEKEMAKERFWTEVSRLVAEKYQLAAVNAVDKYTRLMSDAIELNNISHFKKHSNYVYRIAINSLPNNMDSLRGKYGYFYEYDTDDINNIAHILNTKYQTLTYFGVDKSQLVDFVVKNRSLGIDRIVPLGKALEIEAIWDGYDVMRSLSRIINVR
jgi:hypothetical protein